MGASIGGHAPLAGSLADHVSALADGAGAFGERAAGAVSPLLERAMELAGSVGEKAGDRAARVGEAMSAKAASLAHVL